VNYAPTKSVYMLSNRTVSENDHFIQLSFIPQGNHILTITTPPGNLSFITTITHIVVF
jgi:hypothetical protein